MKTYLHKPKILQFLSRGKIENFEIFQHFRRKKRQKEDKSEFVTKSEGIIVTIIFM